MKWNVNEYRYHVCQCFRIVIVCVPSFRKVCIVHIHPEVNKVYQSVQDGGLDENLKQPAVLPEGIGVFTGYQQAAYDGDGAEDIGKDG